MSKITQQLFVDELDAIQAEYQFALGLDSGRAPFTSIQSVHIGEGGCTTIYQQEGRNIGLSNRLRDEFNRTLLVCVDLR